MSKRSTTPECRPMSDSNDTSDAETDAETNVRMLRRLWTPHPGQAAVMNHPARFRIVAAGRRWGKSEMAAHEILEYALEHRNATCWWVSPTYDMSNRFGFDKIKPLVSPDVLASDPKRTKPRAFEFDNGSRISFRSAEREDSLRGPGIDFLVIDEAGSVPERAWTDELRPALADTEGDMLAIGTPRGRNWFHSWWNRGQSADHPSVASWRAPTEQNRHVPDAEIAAAESDMPERVFRQEHLAEFVDDSGGVFGNVRAHVAEYDLPVSPSDAASPYAIGVDFARFEDWTVITVLDADGRLVAFDRLRETTWNRIQQQIERRADEYDPSTAAVDATRDNKIVADLEDAGVDVEPVNFSSDKQTLIDNLITSLENGDVTLSDDAPQLINELEVYEYERTDSGKIRYRAPSGFKDDSVDALALAAHAKRETRDLKAGGTTIEWGEDAISTPDARTRGHTSPADTAPDALGDDSTNIF